MVVEHAPSLGMVCRLEPIKRINVLVSLSFGLGVIDRVFDYENSFNAFRSFRLFHKIGLFYDAFYRFTF